MAFDHKIPDVPKYAPFVAAGFFFGPASFLKEVKYILLGCILGIYVEPVRHLIIWMFSRNAVLLMVCSSAFEKSSFLSCCFLLLLIPLQVPFDPFLPWIFMGEEISMSARWVTTLILFYVVLCYRLQ